MRGKPPWAYSLAWLLRIIPAHAGQTKPKATARTLWPDHPRACGANRPRPASRWTLKRPRIGSSPRMRGKHDHGHRILAQRRIIPAHAGQTEVGLSTCFLTADHPRACGANINAFDESAGVPGSSPRMRGKLRVWSLEGGAFRIIPAHAGQTNSNQCALGYIRDHPRACGANESDCPNVRRVAGSSPRMRGKRPAAIARRHPPRIIPAHAGQT